MSVDPAAAAASLDDVAAVERRTRETLFYAGAADILILWGVLSVAGHLLQWLAPHRAAASWIGIDAIGGVGTMVVLARRVPLHVRRLAQFRWGGSLVAFLAYGFILLAEAAPRTAAQFGVFWSTLVMFGYVLMGIWSGRFLLLLGIAGTVLLLAGYAWAGAWFLPWSAAVLGGGLIAGGLWLRRAA